MSEALDRLDERVETVDVQQATATDGRILIEVDLDEPELGPAADCRAPGCVNEANWTRGYYAYLCTEHAAAKRKARDSPSQPDVRVGGAVAEVRDAIGHVDQETGLPAAGALQAAARALVAPAGRLERATERRRLARGEAIAAVEEFNDALRVLRELAQRLIA